MRGDPTVFARLAHQVLGVPRTVVLVLEGRLGEARRAERDEERRRALERVRRAAGSST